MAREGVEKVQTPLLIKEGCPLAGGEVDITIRVFFCILVHAQQDHQPLLPAYTPPYPTQKPHTCRSCIMEPYSSPVIARRYLPCIIPTKQLFSAELISPRVGCSCSDKIAAVITQGRYSLAMTLFIGKMTSDYKTWAIQFSGLKTKMYSNLQIGY